MTEWRNLILDKIKYITSSKIFISDYEALLSDDELLVTIRDIGFDYLVIDADTGNIEVRYQYENFFRNNDNDIHAKRLLVILQDKKRNKTDLPYDIVFGSIDVTLNLSDIFLGVDSEIIRLLDHSQYEDLFDGIVYESISRTILTKQQSLIFVLRNVFHIHLLEIKSDVDFAALLFNVHYTGINIPEEIAAEIERFFLKNGLFCDWKIKKLLTSSAKFWNYIQQLWDAAIGYTCYYFHDGAESLDILNPKLVIYLDNAFSSGYMKARPVVADDDKRAKLKKLPESLLLLGIIHEDENSIEAIERKKSNLFERISVWDINDKSTYKDWIEFSQLYSQWLNLIERSGKDSESEHRTREKINQIFASWLSSHFDALCYETTAYPLMVFRILSYLAKKKRMLGDAGRIALIVIDGMSYSDWITIKTGLSDSNDKLSFEEHSCFAWVPTLTSVSRQVIFSGKLPRDFSKTIGTTSNEENEWKEAWTKSFPLMPNNKIKYIKTYDENDEDRIASMMDDSSVFGIVINAVDELLHSSHVLGSSGLHNNIKQWVDSSLLEKLLTRLLDNDFHVFITADHGNTSVVGTGRINEGKLATEKGQRARIYNSSALRANAYEESTESIQWNSSTLPSDYLPLLSSFGSAFITKGEREITHGGVSIEEVVVPFIEVKRNV